MKLFTIAPFLLMVLPATLAEPCVLQYTVYNVNARTQTQSIQICYDTNSKTCKGTAQTLTRKSGAQNIVNECTYNNGQLLWKLGTGWRIFGQDLESVDIKDDVGTSGCSLKNAHDLQWKIVGIPASLWRHDGGGVSAPNSCPF